MSQLRKRQACSHLTPNILYTSLHRSQRSSLLFIFMSSHVCVCGLVQSSIDFQSVQHVVGHFCLCHPVKSLCAASLGSVLVYWSSWFFGGMLCMSLSHAVSSIMSADQLIGHQRCAFTRPQESDRMCVMCACQVASLAAVNTLCTLLRL